MKSSFTRFIGISVLTFTATGCAILGGKTGGDETSQRFALGNYKTVSESIESDLQLTGEAAGTYKPIEGKSKNVLAHLEAAENWRMAGNRERSTAHYDVIENMFKGLDQTGLGAKTAKNAAALLTSDKARGYVPTPAERILTNFYKAISFWSAGDTQNARIEFNRANDRARRAVERYKKEINKKEDKKTALISAGLKAPGVSSALKTNFPSIDQWEVYDDFVNPAVAYTNALFLAKGSAADLSKAHTLVKRVRGMVGPNSAIDNDLANLQKSGHLITSDTDSWVIFESGLSPKIISKTFSAPWITPTGLISIDISLPSLENRITGLSEPGFIINAETIKTEQFASMEKVMRTEFKKRWKGTLVRSFSSAAVKGMAQNEVNRRLGLLGNITSWFFSKATTGADTRGWKAMPEGWSVTKINSSNGTELKVPYGPGLSETITVPAKNSVIYIKQPSPRAKPLIEILPIT